MKICRGIRGGRRPTTTPGKFSRAQPRHQVVSIYFSFSFHEYHQRPPGFNFFFDFHEYHKWFSSFLAKIFVNTTKNIKKIDEYQVTKKQNMRGLCWNPVLVIFRTRIQLWSFLRALIIRCSMHFFKKSLTNKKNTSLPSGFCLSKKKRGFGDFLNLFVTLSKANLEWFRVFLSLAGPFYLLKEILTILEAVKLIAKDFLTR